MLSVVNESKPSGVVYEMIRGSGALASCSVMRYQIAQLHAPNFNPLRRSLIWTKHEQITLILERLVIFLANLLRPRIGGVSMYGLNNQVDRAISAQRFWNVDGV
jgi:hypothetical protein